jgi:hypothetical protein
MHTAEASFFGISLITTVITSLLSFVISVGAKYCCSVDSTTFATRQRNKLVYNVSFAVCVLAGIAAGLNALLFARYTLECTWKHLFAFLWLLGISWHLELLCDIGLFTLHWARERKFERESLKSQFCVSFLEYCDWQRQMFKVGKFERKSMLTDVNMKSFGRQHTPEKIPVGAKTIHALKYTLDSAAAVYDRLRYITEAAAKNMQRRSRTPPVASLCEVTNYQFHDDTLLTPSNSCLIPIDDHSSDEDVQLGANLKYSKMTKYSRKSKRHPSERFLSHSLEPFTAI